MCELRIHSVGSGAIIFAEVNDKRWTAEYYRSTQRMFSVYSAQSSLQLVTSTKEHRRKLSQHQKFRKASLITAELASLASGASGVHFERRIKLLKELVASWKENEEVALVEVNPSKDYKFNLILH